MTSPSLPAAEESIDEAETPSPAIQRNPAQLPLAVAAVLVVAGITLGGWGMISREPDGPPRPQPEVPVTAMEQGLGVASNSPVIIADPNQPLFIVLANRLDAPDFNCALQLSGDGGKRWISAKPVPALPPGAEKCYAPEVAFDSDGVLYYLFVGLAGTGNEPMGAFLTSSSDRGQTFSAPRRVLGPLNFGVRMAIDPKIGAKGRIHLVWLHATSDPPLGAFGPPPNPIMTAHSDDGGKTFSEPLQVSDPKRDRVVAPALALGPDRTVHIAYYDLKNDAVDYQGLEGPTWEGTWALVMATSTDGGRRFSRGTVVDDAIGPPERVMLIFTMPPAALATQGKRVCAAWTDARRGDPDVVLRCSSNRGRSWGGIRRLNDDRVNNGTTQYLPRIALSPGGRLDAIFYDRRHDSTNVLNAVYFTTSRDGGRRFSRNVRITRDLFESRIGQRYSNVSALGRFEYGSRIALWSEGSRAVAAWTDTRNSRLFTGSSGQDIFAAEVQLPTRPRMNVALAGAGISAIGAVTIGAGIRQRRRRRGPTEPES